VNPSNRTALVIDDDKDANELVCDLLKMRGINVLTVATRDQALPYLDQLPGLILMDCQMPGMSAADFMLVARSKRPVPVILITARADGPEKARSLAVTRFFPKPFNVKDLADAAEDLLK
jgi:CheY-like chemotaxis protein